MLLVIINRFRWQDNDDLRELCTKKNCEIVIIPHILTNRFQPLDLSVNKLQRHTFLKSTKLGQQTKNSKQLKKGIAPPDSKVSLLLLVLKLLVAKFVIDLYRNLKADKEMIVNAFRAAAISGAIQNAKGITEKVINLFKELQFFFLLFFLTLVSLWLVVFPFSVIIQKQFIDLRKKILEHFEK